jgi:glycosyltransferase involved in cell wall biosynthesis
MLKNNDIVCFGPSDWWGMNPSCATHIMSRLTQCNRIIYINPISSDILGMRGKTSLSARIFRKIKSALKFFRKVDKHLYVVSPLFVPMQGNRFVDTINNKIIEAQLKLLMLFLNFKDPLLWIENIRAADLIKKFKWNLKIYHASDSFEECSNTRNKEKLRVREAFVSRNSDTIICVSKKLFESKKDLYNEVHYLPHGVDFEKFNEASKKGQYLEQLQNISHPVAGYFGTLTGCNDIELLEYCAVNLPEVTFVFAGQITGGDYTILTSLPNTLFLGKVSYEDVPKLCSVFDVCLLPWKMDKWIANCNPLKLFEYMAAGKPIVSVPIDEVARNYSHLISIAGSKELFRRAIKWELANDTIERRDKRIAIAQNNSWAKHIELLSDIINRNLLKNTNNISLIGGKKWAVVK